MKQISQTDIAIHIHVILTCMPKNDRSAGGWRGEQAVRAATAKIMELFDRAVILAPDEVLDRPGNGMHPNSYRRGQFGVTEPWPAEIDGKAPASLDSDVIACDSIPIAAAAPKMED